MFSELRLLREDTVWRTPNLVSIFKCGLCNRSSNHPSALRRSDKNKFSAEGRSLLRWVSALCKRFENRGTRGEVETGRGREGNDERKGMRRERERRGGGDETGT